VGKSLKGRKPPGDEARKAKSELEEDAKEDLELTDEDAAEVAGGYEDIKVNVGTGMSKNFWPSG
jgi:hypothetical protein